MPNIRRQTTAEPPAVLHTIKVTDNYTTRFLSLILLLALYYLAYRYPFQINSATTSPTYSNTPPILQWVKYLVFLALCGWYWLRHFSPMQSFSGVEAALAFGWAAVLAQALLLVVMSPASIFLLEIPFFSILILVVVFSRNVAINYARLYRTLMWFVVLAFLFNLYQYIAFKAFDRLPALAWGGGALSVRFGAVWDDPNAFGLFFSFIIPFIAFSPLHFYMRGLLFACCGVSLLMTQSISGGIGAISGVLVVLVVQYITVPVRLFGIFASLAASLGVVWVAFGVERAASLYDRWMLEKSGSIEARGSFIADMFGLETSTYLGLNPQYVISENGYVVLLSNFGVLAVAIFIFSQIFTFLSLWQASRFFADPYMYAIINGALGFTAGFSVANMGVPSLVVYPMNLLMVFCVVLAILMNRQRRAIAHHAWLQLTQQAL